MSAATDGDGVCMRDGVDQEARRLMLGEQLDAAVAAFRVGYESPSQFSREYWRTFGAPLRQDVNPSVVPGR